MTVNNPALVDDFPRDLKTPVVRWVIPGWYWSGHVNQAAIAGRIYYQPIFVPEDTTYDRIGVYVSTGDAAGGTCDLRVFEWNAGLPGALVLSAGTVSTNADGAKEIAISQLLSRGFYFLATRFDQTPTMAAIGTTGIVSAPVGALAESNAVTAMAQITQYVAAAYADPAPAPTASATSAYCTVRLREA